MSEQLWVRFLHTFLLRCMSQVMILVTFYVLFTLQCFDTAKKQPSGCPTWVHVGGVLLDRRESAVCASPRSIPLRGAQALFLHRLYSRFCR
jgi:hypothetical protein